MKKVVFASYLVTSLISKAQNVGNSDMTLVTHLEFSIKVNVGYNMPLFNYHNRDGKSFSVLQKAGNFSGAGFQIGLAGRNNFSLLLEGGYGISSNDMRYVYQERSTSPLGGGNYYSGNYHMNIQKTELAVMAKHYVTNHHVFYVNYGFYYAIEDTKTITGTTNIIANTYNNKHISVLDQFGFIQGIGCTIPFKNKSSIFIDLRLNVHRVHSGTDDAFFRISDLGLSVGYTFYKTKNITIAQNSSAPDK